MAQINFFLFFLLLLTEVNVYKKAEANANVHMIAKFCPKCNFISIDLDRHCLSGKDFK